MRRLRKGFALVAILAVIGSGIAGVVVIRAKLNKYLDKTPGYMAGISNSLEFTQPVTVRVNQNEIEPFQLPKEFNYQSGRKAGKAVKTAYIFEALGLLQMSTETTTETRNDPYSGGNPRHIETFDLKHERLIIALTHKGREEAINWRETDEPYQAERSERLIPVSWWRIPIGARLVTRIESATETDQNTVNVAFRWRWVPSKLGEYFDCSGAAFQSMPDKARDAVLSLGWNSQTDYSAYATLRRVGPFWEATQIVFMNEPSQRD
ncbi:MAG: hypothetical protein WAQ99_13010 [Pyrinomonadaceae bacterium]